MFQAHFGNEQWKTAPGPSYGMASGLDYQTGLQIWLAADEGVAGTTPITSWTDQSPNGFVFAGGSTPDLIASQINGLPVIRFAAPEEIEAADGGVMDGTSGATIFLVFQTTNNPPAAPASAHDYLISLPEPAGNGLDIRQTQGTLIGDFVTSAGNLLGAPSTVSPAINDGAPHLVTLRWDDTANMAHMYIGSTLKNSSAVPNGTIKTAGTNFVIGGFSSAFPSLSWTGDMAEALVYDHDVGTSNQTTVWSYLSNKWGVSL